LGGGESKGMRGVDWRKERWVRKKGGEVRGVRREGGRWGDGRETGGGWEGGKK